MGALDGKVSAITGASSGIGEATARMFAEEGSKVALMARRADRLEALAGEISDAGGEALPIEIDVTDHAKVEAAIAEVKQHFGALHNLVNNAGVMLLGQVEGWDITEWRRMVDLNLLGLLYCTREALPVIRESGGGHIVNVSSVAGRTARKGSAVYNMTKWGVTGFSEALRQEALESGIRVTCIEPGYVETELQSHNQPEVKDRLEGMKDEIGDVLQSEDIARGILYAVGQAEHVNVNEILIRPTRQRG